MNTETKPPTNFLTPNSIDNLSIAGVSVWLICLTIASLSTEINSFWVRIVAFTISFIWSISLFVKNKRWNKLSNYVIILVNAVLIYVNAAGINTVTRQSPFEGYGVKTDSDSIKIKVTKAAILDLTKQTNWYPEYDLLRYIDTLKQSIYTKELEREALQNEFSYIKDNINNVTNDKIARTNITNFLKNFGKSKIDSTSFGIMKNQFKVKIDSLENELKFRNEHPIRSVQTVSSTFLVDGKSITAEEYINQNFDKISSLETKNINLVNLINFVKRQKSVPYSTIDSIMKKNGY